MVRMYYGKMLKKMIIDHETLIKNSIRVIMNYKNILKSLLEAWDNNDIPNWFDHYGKALRELSKDIKYIKKKKKGK